MKKYILILDEHVKIWRRTHYEVQAETLEEAINITKNKDGEVIHSEFLYETEEPIDSYEYSTIEIYDDSMSKLLYEE